MLKNFADDLKSLRESKNITLEELSSQTRVRISIFEKLESGDFSFQPATYIRAFLKQYAKAIDVEPDELLKDFDDAKLGKYKKKTSAESEKIELSNQVTAEKKEVVEISSAPVVETESKSESVLPRKLPESTVKVEKIRKPENVEERDIEDYRDNTLISGDILKKILVYILGVGFLIGVFFMVKSLFFADTPVEPEIIRQRGFNEIVEENERKLLGKRTEEEIQDSIRKAQEELMQQVKPDSLSLEIVARGRGRIFIASDSLNINSPRTYDYLPGDTGLYFAKRFFHFGINDPATVDVYLNERKIELPQRRFRNLMIDSSGVRQPQTIR